MQAGLVVWDVDGTLIPADLRQLRRAVARTYDLDEDAVIFPSKRVHGYTDESIVIDTAISSGVSAAVAEAGIPIVGRLRSEFYEQQDGDGRVKLNTEVVVDEIEYLSRPPLAAVGAIEAKHAK